MVNTDLEKYIQSSRAQGATDDAIKNALVASGWPAADVLEFMAPQQAISLPIPPLPHFGMWVTFKYILLFICLYVSAFGLAIILNEAINTLLPDALDRSYSFLSGPSIQSSVAGIIVTFPIFAILFVMLRKEIIARPAVRNLRARKKLFYITLVITFIIMISHLISVVYGFLGGTTTLRSLGHFLVTLSVAGSIFIYLLMEIKVDRNPNE